MPSSHAAADLSGQRGRRSNMRLVFRRRKDPLKPGTLLLWVVLLLGSLWMGKQLWMEEKDLPSGLEIQADGEIGLSAERQAKLDRELSEIDNAIQYALVAGAAGVYPCYSCPNGQKTIFLNFGEVWKYGVTRKGAEGRYPQGNFGAPNLLFIEQFVGTFSECLKMEKTMIYSYPMLPQAQAREPLLIRPPGNKYDT